MDIGRCPFLCLFVTHDIDETIGYTFCKAERLCSRSRFERSPIVGF